MSEQPDSPYLFDINSPYTIGLGDLRLRLEPLLVDLIEEGSAHASVVQGALDCLLQVEKRDHDYEAAYQRIVAGHLPCRIPGCSETFHGSYLRDNHEHAHDHNDKPCGNEECEFYCTQEDDDD